MIHSGRFNITKISTNLSFNEALDEIVLNLLLEYRNDNFPLHIEFSHNEPIYVEINNENVFYQKYSRYIDVLTTFNYEQVEFKFNDEWLYNVVKLYDDVDKLKNDIMLFSGGKIFNMFPACVGYALNRYNETLIKLKSPHELLYIDDEIFKKYIRHKLFQFD